MPPIQAPDTARSIAASEETLRLFGIEDGDELEEAQHRVEEFVSALRRWDEQDRSSAREAL